MLAPDYVEPLVGYRTWHWTAAGIKSLNGTFWPVGEPLSAWCRNDHEPPGDGCTCGVYAARTLDHLTEINYRDFGISGEVHLWGKVWQHELGYRAEFAYPRKLVVPPGFLPANLSILETKVKALTAYGQPVIVEASKRTPWKQDIWLWDKEQGYNGTAVDWLLSRPPLATIRPALCVGDRVAIHNVGIAIVSEIGGDDSVARHVRLRLLYARDITVPLPSIAWDERNWRWEVPAAVGMRSSTR